MKQYIDKAAVVAEIDKKLDKYSKSNSFNYGAVKDLEYLRSFLNTLEVKEVDLELNSFDATVCKIGNTYLKEMDRDAIVKALESYKDGDKVKVIIKAKRE